MFINLNSICKLQISLCKLVKFTVVFGHYRLLVLFLLCLPTFLWWIKMYKNRNRTFYPRNILFIRFLHSFSPFAFLLIFRFNFLSHFAYVNLFLILFLLIFTSALVFAGEVRGVFFPFQHLSVSVQRFNAVLLHDSFALSLSRWLFLTSSPDPITGGEKTLVKNRY